MTSLSYLLVPNVFLTSLFPSSPSPSLLPLFSISFLSYSSGVKLSTSRPANAVTRSEPSSGRLSLMNTVLTQQAPSTATLISNLSASMSISTKPLADAMSLVPSSSTWSQVPWTLFVLVLSVSSFAQTTLFSAKLEQVTTGPRDTTLRAQS